ncbi:MAG: hypothetical protein ABI539_04710 [Acidobacteriota bacterium]
MKKKLIFVSLAVIMLALAIVAFAFDQTAVKTDITKHHCCGSSSSCPMKGKMTTADADASKCCDSDNCCCKGDGAACPMKGHEQGESMAGHHQMASENTLAGEQTSKEACCDCDCCKDKASA